MILIKKIKTFAGETHPRVQEAASQHPARHDPLQQNQVQPQGQEDRPKDNHDR